MGLADIARHATGWTKPWTASIALHAAEQFVTSLPCVWILPTVCLDLTHTLFGVALMTLIFPYLVNPLTERLTKEVYTEHIPP